MSTTQQATSLSAFASAMLAADAAFADRVERLDRTCGPVGDDGRALLAQAAYFCWHHGEYEANLLATCRAIGAGRPSHLYLCGHVTPARWRLLHAYVIGAQRWLGQEGAVPGLVDAERTEQVGAWLGEPTPAREALARLFLCQLVDHLVRRAGFCVLTDGPPPEAAEYLDFSAWYERPDGGWYGLSGAAAAAAGAEADGLPLAAADDGYADACAAEARSALADAPGVADALIAGILRPSQPPGMHRFTRYQDVKLASIGQLRWRADLPADGSRAAWERFWAAAEAGLAAWLDGTPPDGAVAACLHEALGPPADQSRAAVADFLLEPPPGEGCFAWLLREAHGRGATAGAQAGVAAG